MNLSRRVILTTFIFLIPFSLAAGYHGRLTYGSFVSQETLATGLDGFNHNDFATMSARMFFMQDELWGNDSSMTVDLRDKHDFFSLLDRERKELSDENNFQARQISVQKDPKKRGVLWELGRFPVQEAGSVFNDGVRLGYRFSNRSALALFGGLNPKPIDRAYLLYRPNANVYGLYHDFQSNAQRWNRNFIFKTAFVTQSENNEIDRQFLYNNFIYQWNWGSLVTGNLYLDFVPRTYIQNGILSYQQQWTKSFRSNISLITMDVIQYRRQQDLRELLQPSPYKEAQASFNFRMSPKMFLITSHRLGQREFDNKERVINSVKLSAPGYFSNKWDFSTEISQKNNFTQKGMYGGLSIGYFSSTWECNMTGNVGKEIQTNGSVLNPFIAEGTVGYRYSRRIFGFLSYQNAHDENASISTVFFKITYRFGNKEISPIRDGAAPRGRL